jgi:hypothetical protein
MTQGKPPAAGASSVQGKNLKGDIVTLRKEDPYQLSLFQSFLPEEKQYSNTIELYDAIPKYFASSPQMEKLRKHEKYLETLKREFVHRGSAYKAEIKPARVEFEGAEKEYYPTAKESLVEEAIRKLALKSGEGAYLDGMAGVQFTLFDVQKELKARGHATNYNDLIKSLKICHEAKISVATSDGKHVVSASIFPILLISGKSDWIKNPKNTRCFVQFNPLVTHGINRISYRQFDYIKYMEYKRHLTRWLHKRLSHNYTGADADAPYAILASTIIRDSGLVNCGRFRDGVHAVESALDELRDHKIIGSYGKEARYASAGKRVEDIKYLLHPSREFIQEVKYANKRLQERQAEAQKNGYTACV